ncbi:NAD-dependent epimerase/dehydratase family protein [Ligilactobacillus sp.]|uniref:NAD-dependent epimerase/dehydratase family protein n=1 Tax=Ligilactobacillus sp. TaxID=2767921 RepID=UPI002FE3B871
MALNNVLTEDLDSLLASEIEWSNFKDKRILVTGATGLVGSMVVRSLIYANEKFNLGLKVIGLIRNQAKADKIYEGCMGKDALSFCLDDLSGDEPVSVNGRVDYIVHAAAVTTSKIMVEDPVGTIDVALKGTRNILNLAAEKKARGTVYISSMEIYGQSANPDDTTEEDLGYVDLTAVRSCYPEGKRMCECMCTAYAAQYGLKITSARLAQTFGAGVLPTENRVFAQFARSALRGENIVLRTEGKSEGNYVYTIDAVRAILMLLYKGEPGQAYNVANEESHTTIRKMAELVSKTLSEGKSEVIIDIPENSGSLGYAPDVRMKLNAGKMRRLGWKPTVGLSDAYRRMAEWMKETDMIK